MADNKLNVGFKRGLHANLPTSNAIEGVFYLTTDTERFYVGKSDGSLAELNKSVRPIATLDALKALQEPAMAVGDFYYIVDKNILAVYIEENGTKSWKQVNPDTDTDTKVHSASFSIATSNDIATITQTIKLADKNNSIISGVDKTSSFTIASGDGVKVTSSGTRVTLSGDYSLSVAEGTNAADINLLASGTEKDDFTIAGGDNVTVTTDVTNKKVTIAAKDTIVTSAKAILTADGKIDIELKDQEGNTVSHTASDAITYKVDGTSYIPGAELPIYTKDQIDTKLNTLNGLTYRGTVGSGGSIGDNLPTTNVSIGDMYLVVGDVTVTGSGHDGKKGDLFIATGTNETNNVITGDITWTYVPSGDDTQTDTTYKAVADSTTHSLTLKDNGGAAHGGIALNPGEAITLVSVTPPSTSGNGSILETTINHADISRTKDSHNITPTDENTNTIVTGISVNDQGHVIGVQTANIEGSVLNGYELLGTDTVTETQVTTVHQLKTGDGTIKGTVTDVVSSSSLKFAAVNNGYSINLEWDTF